MRYKKNATVNTIFRIGYLWTIGNNLQLTIATNSHSKMCFYSKWISIQTKPDFHIFFLLLMHSFYFSTPSKHNLLKNLLSFIANDPNCLGRSNGWYWEFTNTESSSSSNCLFDREINGTHVIYKTTVESKLPEAEISPLITRSRNLIMDFTCSLEVSSSS